MKTIEEEQENIDITNLRIPPAEGKGARKVIQFDLEGNPIKLFSGVTEASKHISKLLKKDLDNVKGHLYGACGGRYKYPVAYGFQGRFADELINKEGKDV